ncbi:MAG: alanine racemase [Acidobacteria bacterium]|nr:alanine racemase [Acidobacteriota bacterium]
MPCRFRSWVEVSRAQIAANFRALKATVGPSVEVMPVVKADAYRHGAVQVAQVLAAEGARWLAVSNVEEGAELRQAGISSRILVMADFLPVERPALVEFDLTPVIHSLDDIAEYDRLSRSAGRPLSYHLKIDSGMGRLGTRSDAEAIYNAVTAAGNVYLEGLMSHFASAADYSSAQSDEQITCFSRLRCLLGEAGLRPRFRHLSSTAPIAYGRQDAWLDMVRPGLAIYGYVPPAQGPAPPITLDVKPALTWKTQVLSVKDIPSEARIGYGAIFQARNPIRIAVLAVGYADGLPHQLTNRGIVIVNGKSCAMLGAVSMDMTTIDATACPELAVGDAVTILGSDGGVTIDARQIASEAGAISYSVLCGIQARVRRVYV